jgi:hypothetical protein
MYATAHRVRFEDRKTGEVEVGINSFLYLHRGQSIPGSSWEAPDAELIAEQHPGILVKQSYDLPPSGNIVISYLDVAAQDAIDPVEVEKALQNFQQEIGAGLWPRKMTIDSIGMRFGIAVGSIGLESEEYAALRSQLLAILREPTDTPVFEGGPLVVEVKVDENGFNFRFDESSLRRIWSAHPDKQIKKNFSVEHLTKMEFERMHGDMVPYIINALTSPLRLEQVILFGGVRFLQARTGKVLREWPSLENNKND